MKPRTVTTVADLTKRHDGKQVRIPGLQQPGADFDAPRVTVTGRYYGKREAHSPGWWWLDVRLRSDGALQLDTPLPGIHPCYLTAEDPARPQPVEVALFEETA